MQGAKCKKEQCVGRLEILKGSSPLKSRGSEQARQLCDLTTTNANLNLTTRLFINTTKDNINTFT